jgi:hypothetical protein
VLPPELVADPDRKRRFVHPSLGCTGESPRRRNHSS